ncbi:MAG: acetyl-CoA carboxylase biotin carboxylase subunit [Actinomycetota bacterium]|nr:acetyl-CoA carboxylase biotin carboxylase subunit [Actinomycetota bacterium]
MKSILIANRGEIAVRVIRAASELGLRTIAIYSELDRDARHVRLADEAWNVGPAPSADSYLNMERILQVATESGAEAVHPGYGFLAENAGFAGAVTDAGLVWVGPSAEAIATMGDKIASRRAAEAAGVSGVPGTLEPLDSPDDVAAFADEHGYPIAIKAAHGGGGKGLKVVREPGELAASFESAQREADAYFRNAEVYVERYLDRPRHVEAQLIADTHGNVVFLGERDCTMQRRHQKLIEEAPAPNFPAEARHALGAAAIAVAKAANYVNAGTVEFLFDGEDVYFLEMNTRIQVEHTVTEMVTGIDLVKEQILVAQGLPLSFTEPEVRGHAIEFRVNAEDPAKGFLPSPGTIIEYDEPGGFGVRVDSGAAAGSAISQYYDNLVAKLVVWGRDREEAIDRGRTALQAFHITGIATTIPAHLAIIDTEAFATATHYTRFVEDHLDFSGLAAGTSPALPQDEEVDERTITVEVGGRRFGVKFWAPVMAPTGGGGQRMAPRRRPPKLERQAPSAEGAGVVTAPMQGTIVKVNHGAGDTVSAGDPLCVLEAMKMENEIVSPVDGAIVDLRIQPGDTVASGSVLMVVR